MTKTLTYSIVEIENMKESSETNMSEHDKWLFKK